MFRHTLLSRAKSILFTLVLSLSIACCGTFQPTLPKLHPEKSFSQEQGIKVSLQAFTQQECTQFFHTNLIQKGFRPIILHLENKTFSTYRLSHIKSPLFHEPISLTPISTIAHALHLNTLLITSTLVTVSLTLYAQLIPAILAIAAGMIHHNAAISAFLEKNSFDDPSELKILPYQTVQKLMFFPETQFTSNFEIYFLNDETKKVVPFNVDLIPHLPHLPHLTLA